MFSLKQTNEIKSLLTTCVTTNRVTKFPTVFEATLSKSVDVISAINQTNALFKRGSPAAKLNSYLENSSPFRFVIFRAPHTLKDVRYEVNT